MIGSAVKANQVFLPVLENSSKAQRLRTTLSVFDRSKFFFSLPGSLAESIEAVSLENCVIDCLIVVTDFVFLHARANMKLPYERTTRANFSEILGRGK